MRFPRRFPLVAALGMTWLATLLVASPPPAVQAAPLALADSAHALDWIRGSCQAATGS